MKRTALVIILIFTLILTACGNSTETNSNGANKTNSKEVNETLLDLTGNWVEKGKEFDDSYLAGYIKGDRIEVFWMSEGGDSSSLYWSGTYEEPGKSTKEYTWESINDRTQMDMALLASGDDTKDFKYKNEEISFELSIMGETATIVLVSTDTDYMSIGNITESADTSNLQQVELIDSGYGISYSDGSVTVYYAVNISNPNQGYAIEFPKILITVKDADGRILETDEMVLNGIAAGDEYIYGNSVFYEGDVPETVDISVSNSDNDYIAQSSSGIVPSDNFVVSNISENLGTYDRTYTGEVLNNSTEDFDSVVIILIYKSDDNIVGGETSYVDDLRSGSTKPFKIDIYSDFEDYDSYEILAIQW